jgi:hypothetical protein
VGNKIKFDAEEEVVDHINYMEAYLGDAETMLKRLMDREREERDGDSHANFEALRGLAQTHGTAALVLMQAEVWEATRRPPWQNLGIINPSPPWQDSPVAPPGGPLRGPDHSPGDPPPPVAP